MASVEDALTGYSRYVYPEPYSTFCSKRILLPMCYLFWGSEEFKICKSLIYMVPAAGFEPATY
jgi:hypothetical protein